MKQSSIIWLLSLVTLACTVLCAQYGCPSAIPKEALSKGLQEQLMLEIRAGDEPAVRRLLAAGARADGEAFGRFERPLEEAINAGNINVIELLIGKGADIEKLSELGHTALVLAVDTGALSVIHALLRLGAHTEATGTLELTPLVAAAMRGREDIVRLLFRYGAQWPTPEQLQNVPGRLIRCRTEQLLNRPTVRESFDQRMQAMGELARAQERDHGLPRDLTRLIGADGGMSSVTLGTVLPPDYPSTPKAEGR